ncbi:zinc-ribbon domain-containing protein [Halobacillus mangrovi]|uniref:zinc-ribbon domain-containing protein n=1 Tax=Halobacillus mangrovi TaxID=402384 RepID=UPI003D96E9F8
MYCSDCGAEVEKESNFCGGCGASLTQEETREIPVANVQEAQQAQQRLPMRTEHKKRNSDFVGKAKVISKQFFQFTAQTFKAPFSVSRQVNERDVTSGIIANVLLAFFISFIFYLMMRDMSSGFVDVPFFSTVFQPFFYILIFLTVFIAVNFGIAKMMKSDVTFPGVIAKFGSLNAISVTFFFLSSLFGLISLNTFSTFLFFIGLSLFGISTVVLLFSLNAEKSSKEGLDVFYGLFISNLTMAVIYFLVWMSIFERIVDEVRNVPFGMF